MAGINPSEIRVGGTGSVLIAPVGAAVPAAGAAFAAAWKDLGLTTNEGVKISKKDKLDPIDSWQSSAAVRMVQSDRDLTVKFTLIQVNIDTLPFFFNGDPTALTGTAPYTLDVMAISQPPEFTLAIEFKDGSSTSRLFLPRAVVTENDEITISRSSAVKFGVTVAALASATTPAKLATWQTP